MSKAWKKLKDRWEYDRGSLLVLPLILAICFFILWAYLSNNDSPCTDATLRCRVQQAEAAGCDIAASDVRWGEDYNEDAVRAAVRECGF